MSVSFATSYIDRIFSEGNVFDLYQAIGVLSVERKLSEEFWVFCRLLEWTGSARSGSWQYYEGLPKDTFERVGSGMERLGLGDAAKVYRSGFGVSPDSEAAAKLDRWIDENEQRLLERTLRLIDPLKIELYPQS